MFQDTFQILGGVFFALEHICRIYFSVHKKTKQLNDYNVGDSSKYSLTTKYLLSNLMGLILFQRALL